MPFLFHLCLAPSAHSVRSDSVSPPHDLLKCFAFFAALRFVQRHVFHRGAAGRRHHVQAERKRCMVRARPTSPAPCSRRALSSFVVLSQPPHQITFPTQHKTISVLHCRAAPSAQSNIVECKDNLECVWLCFQNNCLVKLRGSRCQRDRRSANADMCVWHQCQGFVISAYIITA